MYIYTSRIGIGLILSIIFFCYSFSYLVLNAMPPNPREDILLIHYFACGCISTVLCHLFWIASSYPKTETVIAFFTNMGIFIWGAILGLPWWIGVLLASAVIFAMCLFSHDYKKTDLASKAVIYGGIMLIMVYYIGQLD